MTQRANEIGFTMCRVTASGELTHGPLAEGTPDSVNIPVSCPPGSSFEGLFHTHPGGSSFPSPTDIRSAKKIGASVLCIDADGDTNCFRVRK